jgi:very-short-patch-repair endonuclease
VATWELHLDGFDRTGIRDLVRAGRILRVRQGWYAEPDIHDDLARAARVGGRATCATLLRLRGAWVAPDRRLHVSVPSDACQLRNSTAMRRRLATDRQPVRVHWSDAQQGRSRLMVDELSALRHYAACARPELVGASAESLLRQHPRLAEGIRRFAASAPPRLARVLQTVDGTTESGTEFLLRWRLRGLLAHPLRPQVPIPGVGRVDFVLGSRLVIEVDGFQYHSDPLQFEQDRARDAALSSLGFRVLRFSYHQVMQAWPSVQSAILAAVVRGDCA